MPKFRISTLIWISIVLFLLTVLFAERTSHRAALEALDQKLTRQQFTFQVNTKPNFQDVEYYLASDENLDFANKYNKAHLVDTQSGKSTPLRISVKLKDMLDSGSSSQ